MLLRPCPFIPFFHNLPTSANERMHYRSVCGMSYVSPEICSSKYTLLLHTFFTAHSEFQNKVSSSGQKSIKRGRETNDEIYLYGLWENRRGARDEMG